MFGNKKKKKGPSLRERSGRALIRLAGLETLVQGLEKRIAGLEANDAY
jgi:hypothetical protein